MDRRDKENNPFWKGDEIKRRTGYDRANRWFDVPEGYERHHKDGDPTNNERSNVEFLTRREHMEKDGRLEKLRKQASKAGKKRVETAKRDSKGRFLPKEALGEYFVE